MGKQVKIVEVLRFIKLVHVPPLKASNQRDARRMYNLKSGANIGQLLKAEKTKFSVP